MCLPQNRHFAVNKDEWDIKVVNPKRMHCMYSNMVKGTFQAEVTLNNEKIKPAIVELCESEGISQLVSYQSVEIFLK